MPAPEVTRKILLLINTANEETLLGWAENWLNHVARNNPELIQEEIDNILESL